MPTRAAPRSNDLALIHIAKAQLQIPEDQYRDLLFTIGRVRSSKDLDWAGRQRMIEHFRKCGFKPTAKAGKAPVKSAGEWSFVFRCAPDRQVFLKKIFRLCQAIGALQTPPVAVMSKAWAEGMLKQMRGHNAAACQPAEIAERLEMTSADDLQAMVKALEIHRKRMEKRA